MEDALRMMELVGELAQEVFSLVFGIRTYLDASRLFLQVKEAQKEVPKAGEGLKGGREIGEEANQGPDTGSSSDNLFPAFAKMLADWMLFHLFFLLWKF